MCFVSKTENGVATNYLLVGCVKSLKYYPNFRINSPTIKVYEWTKTKKAELLHVTEIEDIPLVLYAWKDRVLAGVGKCLRYY